MIRPATESDVAAMLRIYAPYIINTTFTFEYTVPTEEEFLARFRRITRQFPWLVWEEDGTVLGYAYGSSPFERIAYQWCSEASIYLAPEAQHRGIGTRLYDALEQILFYQGYRVIYALITQENTHSVDFHSRRGYTQCAYFAGSGIKFGKILDVVWLEKPTVSVEFPNNPPTPWFTLVNTDEKIHNILGKITLS